MAFITTIPPDSAEGELRVEYDKAVQRAGKVWNILQVMSLNPGVLKASMGLYLQVMFGPSPLSRAQREMVAVVVSKTNGCHY